MFGRLGKFVARHWALVLVAWAVLVAGPKIAQHWGLIPAWNDVTCDGDLAHLPAEMTSVRGEALLRRAFPADHAKSQIVLVVTRRAERLGPQDLAHANRLARTFRALDDRLPILHVWTYRSEVVGRKLWSRDRHAVLVVLQLASEFMAVENIGLLETVRREVEAAQLEAPVGLEVGVTGSAAIGGDMLTSAAESIRNTEWFTVLLVVLILLAVYRAPLLTIVPLLAIAASIFVATDLVAVVADLARQPGMEFWHFKVFKTTRIFVVVILYGAGTDYCLFLVARYKEELARGLDRTAAIAEALGHVGEALAASALTTIVGLATMVCADFGKVASSGPAIALCLTVTLVACITLAPALLAAMGRVVFWPLGQPCQQAAGHRHGSGRAPARGFWSATARMILARPGTILAVSMLVLLPLAYQGLSVRVTYDLLGELRRDRLSVRGTALLRRYFPAGETGPLTLLARSPDGDFDSKRGRRQIALLTKTLYELQGVTSVRSIAEPLGDRPGSLQLFTGAGLANLWAKPQPLTRARFVTQVPELKGRVARLDLILAADPFSHQAIRTLDQVDAVLADLSGKVDSPWHGVQFDYTGTTAGIRDLRRVSESDRRVVQQLVVVAVLAVLILILRRPGICFYLILSVLLSYFVTIGASELFFQWLYGPTFDGLDWKVPLFLFVILIAVGQDYNIYLVTRVFEEQQRRGPIAGLREAIIQTGGIITSCGVIMAGTFVSMMTGTLRGMLELGFALSLGVLLDTLVIRTLLVPSYLALLARRAERAPTASADTQRAPAH